MVSDESLALDDKRHSSIDDEQAAEGDENDDPKSEPRPDLV